ICVDNARLEAGLERLGGQGAALADAHEPASRRALSTQMTSFIHIMGEAELATASGRFSNVGGSGLLACAEGAGVVSRYQQSAKFNSIVVAQHLLKNASAVW
ncbi:MAG: hypothetical protein ABS977_08735, partial [Pseudomonas qingdaonensis]|uniref:hypothetical protein n=1 Tax=Pseudomonas qingdaonensis TaxID=2056231 RepID=UPI003315B9CE